jgi:hypothetical protein
MQSYDEIAMQSLDFADLPPPPSNFLNEFTRFTKTVKLDPWAAEIREIAEKSHPCSILFRLSECLDPLLEKKKNISISVPGFAA